MGPRKNHIGSQRCSLRQTISRLVESARLTNKIQSHVCPAGDNQESRDGRRRGRDWNAVKRGQNKQGNCILGEVDSSNIHAQRETTRYRGSDSKHRTRFRPIEHIEDLDQVRTRLRQGNVQCKVETAVGSELEHDEHVVEHNIHLANDNSLRGPRKA